MGNDLSIDLGMSINGPGSYTDDMAQAKRVQEIEDKITGFINKIAEMPSHVSINITEVVHKIERYGTGGGILGGFLVGGPIGAVIGGFSGHELAEWVKGHEPQVQNAIAALITAAKECLKGLFAPFIIQAVASRWGTTLHKTANDTSNAIQYLDASSMDLEGKLEKAYDKMHESQTKACEVVGEMAKTIQEKLSAMAEASWKVITGIIDGLVETLEPVIQAIADLATVVGVKDAIGKVGELAGKVTKMVWTIGKEAGEFALSAQKFIGETNDAMASQAGLPGMKWPTPQEVLGI